MTKEDQERIESDHQDRIRKEGEEYISRMIDFSHIDTYMDAALHERSLMEKEKIEVRNNVIEEVYELWIKFRSSLITEPQFTRALAKLKL